MLCDFCLNEFPENYIEPIEDAGHTHKVCTKCKERLERQRVEWLKIVNRDKEEKKARKKAIREEMKKKKGPPDVCPSRSGI